MKFLFVLIVLLLKFKFICDDCTLKNFNEPSGCHTNTTKLRFYLFNGKISCPELVLDETVYVKAKSLPFKPSADFDGYHLLRVCDFTATDCTSFRRSTSTDEVFTLLPLLYRRHPQDLVPPDFRELARTRTVLPHLHLQFQYACLSAPKLDAK